MAPLLLSPVLGPVLSREIERDQAGAVVAVGRIYWYLGFAINDEIDELAWQGLLELRASG